MPDSTQGKFALLIRGEGWIDQYARVQPHPHLSADTIDAWVTSDQSLILRFATQAGAEAKAVELTELFGKDTLYHMRWRFSVVEERIVPRWYLVKPTSEREKLPVRSVEQL